MTETNIILNTPIKAVNIGLSLLGDALKQQEIETVQIDWRPPKDVNLAPRIQEILSKLE
jgi:hypothetical protein